MSAEVSTSGSALRVAAERTEEAVPAPSTLGLCRVYLEQISAFDLSAILILLTAVLTGPTQWYIAAPVGGAAVAAIVIPPLRYSKRLWLTLTCVIAAYDLMHWYEADNHKYLLAYAMLAVWISLHLKDRGAAMAQASRWLIVSTFSCALAWKLATRDFANGEFFVWSMLLDERFSGIAQRFVGVDPAMHEVNVRAARFVTRWEGFHLHETVRATASVIPAAKLMVGWTVLVEALVPAAYLVPPRFRLARLASPLLLVFVVTTYAIAPVLGFGYLLLALGAAVEPRFGMRLTYLAVFLALRLHTIPWNSLVDRITG
jgi:hypothetical protein